MEEADYSEKLRNNHSTINLLKNDRDDLLTELKEIDLSYEDIKQKIDSLATKFKNQTRILSKEDFQ